MVGLTDKLRNWAKSGDSSQKINKTCHDPAKDMIECIAETECFQGGRSARDCAENDDLTGIVCKKQIYEWYLCRKFSVDHSKHFVNDNFR